MGRWTAQFPSGNADEERKSISPERGRASWQTTGSSGRPSGNEQMTEKTTIGKTKQKLHFNWVEEGFEVTLSVQPSPDPPALTDTAILLRSEGSKGKENPPLNPAKP